MKKGKMKRYFVSEEGRKFGGRKAKNGLWNERKREAKNDTIKVVNQERVTKSEQNFF